MLLIFNELFYIELTLKHEEIIIIFNRICDDIGFL